MVDKKLSNIYVDQYHHTIDTQPEPTLNVLVVLFQPTPFSPTGAVMLTIGVCVPNSCSETDTAHLINTCRKLIYMCDHRSKLNPFATKTSK